MKILYAASNNENAKIQLSRFLKAVQGKPYTIKIAAYKKSSPNVNIDWTLDCLLNIYKPDHISMENDNFSIYFDQVKYYNPDIIISDMEYFTSYIAHILSITLWQCSSSLINFAVSNSDKYKLGLFKKYSFLLRKNDTIYTQRQINIIDNSNCNFIYSHLGDCESPPSLKDNFEWIRPYHSLGRESVPCRHNIVAGMLTNNKKIFSLLKRHHDSVAFTGFCQEQHPNLLLKDIENQEEYFCNLKNSNLFVCEGQTSFLADAFYNNKYTVVMPNFEDLECLTNSIFSEQKKLSSSIYGSSEPVEEFLNRSVISGYNDKIHFLHERLEEI